jgi:hypothetical protein
MDIRMDARHFNNYLNPSSLLLASSRISKLLDIQLSRKISTFTGLEIASAMA